MTTRRRPGRRPTRGTIERIGAAAGRGLRCCAVGRRRRVLAHAGAEVAALAEVVAGSIAEVLDLDRCRFVIDPPDLDRPRLNSDGEVTWRGRPVDVDRAGLPTMDVVELPVGPYCAFLLTAVTRVRRPTLEQRRVAVTLAEQVGRAAGARS